MIYHIFSLEQFYLCFKKGDMKKLKEKVLAIGDPYYEETNFSYLDFDESVLASNFRSGAIDFSVKNIYGTLGYENWSKLLDR